MPKVSAERLPNFFPKDEHIVINPYHKNTAGMPGKLPDDLDGNGPTKDCDEFQKMLDEDDPLNPEAVMANLRKSLSEEDASRFVLTTFCSAVIAADVCESEELRAAFLGTMKRFDADKLDRTMEIAGPAMGFARHYAKDALGKVPGFLTDFLPQSPDAVADWQAESEAFALRARKAVFEMPNLSRTVIRSSLLSLYVIAAKVLQLEPQLRERILSSGRDAGTTQIFALQTGVFCRIGRLLKADMLDEIAVRQGEALVN